MIRKTEDKDNRKDEPNKHKPEEHGNKSKTTIPPERKAPDTDEEGIGVVHKPQ